jgi:hypothetical protein
MIRILPTLLSMFGMLMTMTEYYTQQAIITTTKSLPQGETTDFYIYMLPSLVGFIASLASTTAPRIAGAIMLLAGLAVMFVITNYLIAFLISLLYLTGGIILLTNLPKP